MIVTDSRTVVMFGKGDVAISVNESKHPIEEKSCVGINIGRIEDGKYKVGENIKPGEDVENVVLLMFDNIDSLEGMKKVVDKAIDVLNEKITKANEDHYMVVNFADITVPDSIKVKTPTEAEFNEAARLLSEKNRTTIVVDKNLELVDGYAEYILVKVLSNLPEYNTVKVIANDGVEIGVCYENESKNDNLLFNIYSNTVCAKYTTGGTLILTNMQKDGGYDVLKFRTTNPIDTICTIGDAVHDLDIIIDTSCGDISDEEYDELCKHFANVLKR